MSSLNQLPDALPQPPEPLGASLNSEESGELDKYVIEEVWIHLKEEPATTQAVI